MFAAVDVWAISVRLSRFDGLRSLYLRPTCRRGLRTVTRDVAFLRAVATHRERVAHFGLTPHADLSAQLAESNWLIGHGCSPIKTRAIRLTTAYVKTMTGTPNAAP